MCHSIWTVVNADLTVSMDLTLVCLATSYMSLTFTCLSLSGRVADLTFNRDSVNKGVEREELWASKTSHYQLNKCHLNVREASISEDFLDNGCSSNSSLIDEGTGIHTDTDDKRAKRLGLLSIGIGKGIDRCPAYASGFKLVTDACADRNPSMLNSVAVNRVRLMDKALGQRSLVYGPVRARLVDAGSTRTIEIAIRIWVLLGEAGHLGVDVFPSHILNIS